MKKKVINTVFLLVFSILLLAGCKENVGTLEDTAVVEASENLGEQEEETPIYRFGFACIDLSNPYYDTLQKSIETELNGMGHSLITKDAASNSDTQIQQVQELIEADVDAVFLMPVDWEAIEPAIQALKEADIPIINVDTQVKNIDEVDAFVGSDNHNAGYLCGTDLTERMPDGGRVVILECPSINAINERITGFEQSVANKGFEIVTRVDTHGDYEQSKAAMESLLAEYDTIDAVMCGNDQAALGALDAVKASGRDGILIYGVDGSPQIKTELSQAGSPVAGTGGQSPINIGKTAVTVGLAILNQEDYEKFTYESTFFINQENVEMYGTDGWQ